MNAISVPLFIIFFVMIIIGIIILLNAFFKCIGKFDFIIKIEMFLVLGGFIICLISMTVHIVYRIFNCGGV
jgi:hypothetical protein